MPRSSQLFRKQVEKEKHVFRQFFVKLRICEWFADILLVVEFPRSLLWATDFGPNIEQFLVSIKSSYYVIKSRHTIGYYQGKCFVKFW